MKPSCFLLCIVCCTLCLACEPQTKDQVKKQFNKAIEEIKTQSEPSLREVEKLHQLDYTVVSFPLDSSAQSIEQSLDELGRNRWDCFHVERTVKVTREEKRETQLLVFCKRLPETYLRYIPKNFLGR